MLQERQIRLLIDSFQNGVKISNRLMRVNHEDEVDFIQGWTLHKREAKHWIGATIVSRTHRALLLCRVMSAKSKSAHAANTAPKKAIVKSVSEHLSANSAASRD